MVDTATDNDNVQRLLIATSTLLQRINLLGDYGGANGGSSTFDGKRDFNKIFGYNKNPGYGDFIAKYRRQNIVRRIVNAPARATWNPEIKLEGPEGINEAWAELVRKHGLYHQFQRVDRLCAIGHYALLLLGFDDSIDLSAPLQSGGQPQLLYTKAISEPAIKSMTLNNDPRNPRFGQPEYYNVSIRPDLRGDNNSQSGLSIVAQLPIGDGSAVGTTSGNASGIPLQDIRVHHSRVLHCTEDPLENDLYSTPIMEQVYNLLDDLLKVSGGAAEIFWLTGNRGIQADIDKDMDFDPVDSAKLGDEIEEYIHGVTRFMKTRGVTVTPLGTTTANPKPTFDMIISLISGATGLPRRVLLGAEGGSVASEQDRASWAERIQERRVLFAEPCILAPIVRMLQDVGLLPEGDVTFEWPSAFILSPLEEGQTMAQKARAVGNLSRQIGNQAPMQITSREEARHLIGLDGDLPDSEQIISEDENEQPPEELPQGDSNQSGPPTGQ